MNKILIAAAAMSLIGGSAALAQPYGSIGHDNHGGATFQNSAHRDHGRGPVVVTHRGGRAHWGGSRHHRGHLVCTVRHHHRVCYRQAW